MFMYTYGNTLKRHEKHLHVLSTIHFDVLTNLDIDTSRTQCEYRIEHQNYIFTHTLVFVHTCSVTYTLEVVL